jgi:uncharacterized integral membrane protein (TIGR00697 family)
MKFRFDKLVALYICCLAVAELMGTKSFPIATIGHFNLTASVAIFVIPVLFTITDVVVEVYGRQRARQLVWTGLGVIAVFFLFALLATHLPPTARFAGKEAAYDAVFSSAARIAIASLVAFAVSELLDVYIFSKLRDKMKQKALWFRNNASNFVGQFVDTVLFMFLAFYAFDKPLNDNFGFLAGIILPYWLLKCAMSVIETPLVYLGVRWLRGEKPEPKLKLAKETA